MNEKEKFDTSKWGKELAEWYNALSPLMKRAVNELPPDKMYRFKDSKKQCFIVSYGEPISQKFEDVTVTVQKTGVGGPMSEMGLGILDMNQVFDVKLDDLEIYEGTVS